MQMDKPTTNESNKTCDVALSNTCKPRRMLGGFQEGQIITACSNYNWRVHINVFLKTVKMGKKAKEEDYSSDSYRIKPTPFQINDCNWLSQAKWQRNLSEWEGGQMYQPEKMKDKLAHLSRSKVTE